MKRYGILTGCLILLILNPLSLLANDVASPENEGYLNIATIDSRPLSNDKLLYTAFKDIGYDAAFTTTQLLTGYDMANISDKDGVIVSTPDVELTHPNLRKVPVALEQTYLYAFVREDSGLEIEDWNHLSGYKVGVNTQKSFEMSQFPTDTTVIEKDTAAQVMQGLLQNEYDIAVLSMRGHETLDIQDGIVRMGLLGHINDYLYLHKNHEHLIPKITESLGNLIMDGRGEDILNDIHVPDINNKKTVLHILSSNTEMPREMQFDAKLTESFEDDMSVEWYTIALNSKRFSRDPNRLVYFADLLRQDCVSRNLAAIIVSGDDAMNFVKQYYYLFFRNVPVLFYGIHGNYDEIIKGYEQYFTGITEQISAYETMSLYMKLFPNVRKVYVLNDYMTEGRFYRKAIEDQLEPFTEIIDIEYSADISCNDMLEYVRGLPQDSLVFVGSYFCDSSGQYYSLPEMKRLLEKHCSVPILSVYSTMVEYNAMGGKCLDYESYGEVAADMLTRLLNGEKPEDIKMISNPTAYNRWVFDKIMLDRMNVKEKSLPKDSQIINKTLSIWETDPRFAITLVTLLVLGVAVAIGASILLIGYRRHAEQFVRESKIREVKERLERIINTAPVAFMLTIDGIVVEANEYIKKHTDVQVGEDSALFYTDPNQHTELFEKALSENFVENHVIKGNMSDGSSHRFLSYVGIVEYEGGTGFILWAVDIEERERQKDRLHASQKNLQTILDLLPIPVNIIDMEENSVIYLNKAAIDLFEIDALEDVCGSHIGGFMPATQPDGINSVKKIHGLQQKKLASGELVCFKTTGESFDCLITACNIDYNGKKAALAIMKDLTAEKEYQRMLKSTAEKEREANQLKGRFLVNMSHEIRTPMNAIIGLTEIELHKKLPDGSRDVYKKINISAKNLLEIINDILDLSKIEADKIELFNDEFELEEVINSALLVAAPRLDGKTAEFILNLSLGLPRFIVGDRTRLWQILKNFLDNSAKYTETGTIVLTVSANEKMSDYKNIVVTFVVEDTGIGIDERQMEKLFMPYEQIHNQAQKKYSGTGLGLAISKQLCEIMGGKLDVQSSVGVGTRVTINIPFERSENNDTGFSLIETPGLSGLNVLLVDNEELPLSITKKILDGNKVNCVTARSGEEALEIILERRASGEVFDAILLDYMMDGLNGLETARHIQMSLSKSPKLLMITAHQRRLIETEVKESGIDDIIEKPFMPSHFIHKLCTLLGLENGLGEHEEVYAKFKDARVLLCEDYKLNQEVSVGMLSQFGIETTVAENGKQGIEILNRSKPFDLIFLDLQMPVMDGYETARMIRADSRFDNIPVISLTADAMKEIVQRCMEIGMNDHIAKPIEYDSLYRILLKWLPESKRVQNERATIVMDPLNKALARFGGNKAAYRKALLEFSEFLPDEWADFELAVKNPKETGLFIHKIKGAAGNLSENEIYSYSEQFEKKLRSNNPDKDIYNRLINACNDAKSRIPKQSQGFGKLPLEDGKVEELLKLFNDLEAALQSYNPKACSDVIDSLEKKSWRQVDLEKLQQLYKLARKYEFDDAFDVLAYLKAGLE